MYAGKDYQKGTLLQSMGDLAIPLIDLKHSRNYRPEESSLDILDNYKWIGRVLDMKHEGLHQVDKLVP